MAILEYGLRQLYDMGLLDIILPFILIFTLIFAILQRTKILGSSGGKPMKNFNAVIALVFALAAVIPHILWGGTANNPYLANGFIDVVQVINNALPSVSLIVVAVLAFLIIVGIWGQEVQIGGRPFGGIVTLASILFIIFIFAVSANVIVRLPDWLSWLRDPQTQALIVVILVFGIIIRFIVGPEEKTGNNNDNNKNGFLKGLGEILSAAGGSGGNSGGGEKKE